MQVSRLGQPLVNEVVIPRALKDAFNAIPPTEDAVALPVVLDPEVPKLLKLLFDVDSPPAPRQDLVTIFLTGIPRCEPEAGSNAVRNVAVERRHSAVSGPNRLGILANDGAGYPNGRRVGDDVTDISIRAMAGATPLTPNFNTGINATLGDGVMGNDVPYLTVFPYLGLPHPGNR